MIGPNDSAIAYRPYFVIMKAGHFQNLLESSHSFLISNVIRGVLINILFEEALSF